MPLQSGIMPNNEKIELTVPKESRTSLGVPIRFMSCLVCTACSKYPFTSLGKLSQSYIR